MGGKKGKRKARKGGLDWRRETGEKGSVTGWEHPYRNGDVGGRDEVGEVVPCQFEILAQGHDAGVL